MKKIFRETISLIIVLLIALMAATPAFAAGYRLKEEVCGGEKIVYTYNRDGSLAGESRMSGGEVYETVEYSYGKDRNLTEKADFISITNFTLLFHYDSNGTQIELENPGLGGDVYLMEDQNMSVEKNKQGYVTKVTIGGRFEGESETVYCYTYDKYGRIKTFESGYFRDTFDYSTSGEFTRTRLEFWDNQSAVRERYDAKGRLIESRDQYGTVSTYTYDEDGRLGAEYYDGELEYSCRYETDAYGNVIRMTQHFLDGEKIVTEYRYENAG